MLLGKLDSNMQKKETGPLSYTLCKINSKWIKDLNVRPETIKILEESTGSNLPDISHSNIFLGRSPEAREIKAKINYWDFIKMKSFCTVKKNNQQSYKATCMGACFQMIPDKGLISKIYRELLQLNTPKNK